jgi:hypothetical protein
VQREDRKIEDRALYYFFGATEPVRPQSGRLDEPVAGVGGTTKEKPAVRRVRYGNSQISLASSSAVGVARNADQNPFSSNIDLASLAISSPSENSGRHPATPAAISGCEIAEENASTPTS